MTTALIVADDLTGALDSGVAFATPGRRVFVGRTLSEARALVDEGAELVAVNTGTRDGSAADASVAIADLCHHVDTTAFNIVMKKVDSRLKGHVGRETGILAEALGARRLIAAPAIPSMRRFQRHGSVEGEGIAQPIPVAPLFDREVEVPDIETDADLDALVATDDPALWIGARGLAFALGRRLLGASSSPPVLQRPILVAIGSRDPVTVAQVRRLHRDAQVHEAPDGDLQSVPDGCDVTVIQMTDGGSGRPACEAGEVFAAGVASMMAAARPATVFVSGGETANAILGRLGVDRLELVGEVAPGLPVAVIRTGWGPCQIVTKSGGFGAPELLAEIIQSTVPREEGVNAR